MNSARQLLMQLTRNLHDDMHQAQAGIEPNPRVYTGSHSTFNWVTGPADIAGGDDDWTQAYPGFPISWPI